MSGGSNNGGGFFSSYEELVAEMRSRFGDDVADRVQRSRELSRQPRPLTDHQQAQLDAALGPILRDMRATRASLPQIVAEAHEDRGDEFVCAWIDDGDLGGCGIWVPSTGPLTDQVFWLAEQLAEWASDAQLGRTPPWPPCPDHPGEHHLSSDTKAGDAVWKCEESGRLVCRIGALPGSEPEWEGRT